MGADTFDCAGLIWYIFNEILDINIFEEGIGISTTTKIMTSKYGILTLYKEDDINKDISLIKSGDVLFFHKQSLKDHKPRSDNKYPGHCGIYLSSHQFIHSTRSKNGVVIGDLRKDLNVLVGSKDIVNDEKIHKLLWINIKFHLKYT